MFQWIVTLVSLLPAALMAADGVVRRTTFEKDREIALTIKDNRPVSLKLSDKKGWSVEYRLRFEGTYGSARPFSPEYFEVTGHPSPSSRGEGKLKVTITFVSVAEHAQIGGIALHGDYGVCVDTAVGEAKCQAEIKASREKSKAFSEQRFDYAVEKKTEPSLPVVAEGEDRIPFCTAEPGLKSLEGARCEVSLSDIYEPIEKWFVMFFAIDPETNYSSGSDFSPVIFGDADGNGIRLDKKAEPACLKEKTCLFYSGYVRYWRGKKKTYFVVKIDLEQGRPAKAVAYGLEAFGGKVGR